MRSGGALTLFIGCLPPSLVRGYRGGPKPNSRACAKTSPACSPRQPCCACSECGLQLKYWGTPDPAGGLCGNVLFSDEHGEIGKMAHVSPSHPADVFFHCSSLKVLTQIYIPPLATAATFACSCYRFNQILSFLLSSLNAPQSGPFLQH